jgi:hypothetical protein
MALGIGGGMTLRPLMQSNYWRVQMAWPDSNPRCFGKFHSRTEAEKWIAEHQWLTKLVWAERAKLQPKAALIIFGTLGRFRGQRQRPELLPAKRQQPKRLALEAAAGSDTETRLPIGVAVLPILAIKRTRRDGSRRTSPCTRSIHSALT